MLVGLLFFHLFAVMAQPLVGEQLSALQKLFAGLGALLGGGCLAAVAWAAATHRSVATA